jgi:ubiquinone/menaquinone biosynthesis C-methylase UbiE
MKLKMHYNKITTQKDINGYYDNVYVWYDKNNNIFPISIRIDSNIDKENNAESMSVSNMTLKDAIEIRNALNEAIKKIQY